ncbi:MAG: transcription antitermination factor NusB [Clostridia bacterium]|nr:transcription antitermination factor NusB [Clostridia bacterium]
MTRHESREQAFLLLFAQNFGEDPAAEVIEAAEEARQIRLSDFARSLVDGVYEHKAELDEKISAHSANWNVNRISRVALTAMRLAAYELMFLPDIPVSVSINEAVEIAKRYGGEEDASFLNGVLGGLSREPGALCQKTDGGTDD